MHVHARTRTVKVHCIQMLETEITTDISWDNEASGASAYEYSVAVLCVQKQYDWEHGPINVIGGKHYSCAEVLADGSVCGSCYSGKGSLRLHMRKVHRKGLSKSKYTKLFLNHQMIIKRN